MASIGGKIDALFALREKKRKHEEGIKELEKQMEVLQAELITQLQAEGISSSRGKTATVSISENVVPQVENWDEFYKYISRKKYFHLLERRPSVSGCRELFEKNGRIPGVVPHTRVTLNLRTAK
jgi:hypothetical protein